MNAVLKSFSRLTSVLKSFSSLTAVLKAFSSLTAVLKDFSGPGTMLEPFSGYVCAFETLSVTEYCDETLFCPWVLCSNSCKTLNAVLTPLSAQVPRPHSVTTMLKSLSGT